MAGTLLYLMNSAFSSVVNFQVFQMIVNRNKRLIEFHLAMQVLSDDQVVDLMHPHCMYDISNQVLTFKYI